MKSLDEGEGCLVCGCWLAADPGTCLGKGLATVTPLAWGGEAQEVELEAEAEAVVVAGPRSVLLPSVVAEALVGVEAEA